MASVQDPSAVLKGPQNTSEVVEQEKFYHDKLGILLLLSVLLTLLALGIGGLIFLLRSSAVPPPTFFKVTALDQLVQEPPLDIAGVDTSVLLNWVAEAIMTSNTFNFINYPGVVAAATTYFTPEGFDSYKNALKNSKIIDRVVEKKLVLKLTATDAPQILLERPFASRYLWKIRCPVNLRYQNVTTDTSERWEINIIVMRVPTTQSPIGVLILKYDMAIQS